MNTQQESLRRFVRELPKSRMVYPHRPFDRAKYFFWKAYTPLHPILRESISKIGLKRDRFVAPERRGRQPEYLLGFVAPGQTMQEFIAYCVSKGYGNHFVAFKDDGQVASMRYVEDFVYQYHLRIFDNGEVRGHYEYTPECYPIRHLRRKGQIDRRDVFYRQLSDRIVQAE